MENKAQILDRAQSNSTEFNSSFWMFERHVNIGCLHRWIIHRFMCTSLSLTTDCPKLLPLATSVLGLCPFDFSHERKLCPGRVSMIFLASSRPKSSTLPCGYSESLYRHSQASWSGQVRDGQLKRTPGNIKHVQAAHGRAVFEACKECYDTDRICPKECCIKANIHIMLIPRP